MQKARCDQAPDMNRKYMRSGIRCRGRPPHNGSGGTASSRRGDFGRKIDERYVGVIVGDGSRIRSTVRPGVSRGQSAASGHWPGWRTTRLPRPTDRPTQLAMWVVQRDGPPVSRCLVDRRQSRLYTADCRAPENVRPRTIMMIMEVNGQRHGCFLFLPSAAADPMKKCKLIVRPLFFCVGFRTFTVFFSFSIFLFFC